MLAARVSLDEKEMKEEMEDPGDVHHQRETERLGESTETERCTPDWDYCGSALTSGWNYQ